MQFKVLGKENTWFVEGKKKKTPGQEAENTWFVKGKKKKQKTQGQEAGRNEL